MMQRMLALTGLVALLAAACGSDDAPTGAEDVDFPRLVEDPEAFNGRRVRVSAFYVSSFERSVLTGALTESYPPQAVDPTIWIAAPLPRGGCLRTDEGVTWGEVTAEGTFRFDPQGGFGHLMVWKMELHEAQLTCR